MKKKILILIFCLSIKAFGQTPIEVGVVYIDASNKNTVKDGKTWATAFTDFTYFTDVVPSLTYPPTPNLYNSALQINVAGGKYPILNSIPLGGKKMIGGFPPGGGNKSDPNLYETTLYSGKANITFTLTPQLNSFIENLTFIKININSTNVFNLLNCNIYSSTGCNLANANVDGLNFIYGEYLDLLKTRLINSKITNSKGVRLQANADVFIDNCIFENNTYGIRNDFTVSTLSNYETPLRAKKVFVIDSKFIKNGVAVSLSVKDLTIAYCDIRQSITSAIYIDNYLIKNDIFNYEISNSKIIDNGKFGVKIVDYSTSGRITDENDKYVSNNAETIINLSNNTISGHSEHGVHYSNYNNTYNSDVSKNQYKSSININNSSITENQVGVLAGFITNSAKVFDSNISKNKTNGAEIAADKVDIRNSVFDGNSKGTGAVITYNHNQYLNIEKCSFDYNTNGLQLIAVSLASSPTAMGVASLNEISTVNNLQNGLSLPLLNGNDRYQTFLLKVNKLNASRNKENGIFLSRSGGLDLQNSIINANKNGILSMAENINFVVGSTQFNSNTNDGINAKYSTKSSFNKCTFIENTNGFVVTSILTNGLIDLSYGFTFKETTFTKNKEDGLSIGGGSLDFDNCNFYKNRNGIVFSNYGSIIGKKLRFLENTNYGILNKGSFYQLILNNAEFVRNENGISVKTSISEFDGNQLKFNENKQIGIATSSVGRFKLKNSQISNSKIAIHLNSSENNGGLLQIDSCKIHTNRTGIRAEPLFENYTISNSEFYNHQNTAININSLNTTIKNSRFYDNKSQNDNNDDEKSFSAGLTFKGKNLYAEDCKFYNNITEGLNSGSEANGGAVKILESSSNTLADVVFVNCFFDNNSSSGAGGAVYVKSASNIYPQFYSSVFSNNVASNQGGALYYVGKKTTNNDPFNIVNCTFFNNTTYDIDGGGAISNNSKNLIEVKNSLFLENKQNKQNNIYSSDIYVADGSLNIVRSSLQLDSVRYTNTPGLSFKGIGNYYKIDPKVFLPRNYFQYQVIDIRGVDKRYGTNDDLLRLQATSPFLNIGSNGYNSTSYNKSGLDAAGNERVQARVIDLGAYEGGMNVNDKISPPNVKYIVEGDTEIIKLFLNTDYSKDTVMYKLISGPAKVTGLNLLPSGNLGKIVVQATSKNAKDLRFEICVVPQKPTISINEKDGLFTLTSSSKESNIWFEDNKKLTETFQIIKGKVGSEYYAQIKSVDGCETDLSNIIAIPSPIYHIIPKINLDVAVKNYDFYKKIGSEEVTILPTFTDLGNEITYKIDSNYQHLAKINSNVLTFKGQFGIFKLKATANDIKQDEIYSGCLKIQQPKLSFYNIQDEYFFSTGLPSNTIWHENGKEFKPKYDQYNSFMALYDANYKIKIGIEGCYSDFSNEVSIPKERFHRIPKIEIPPITLKYNTDLKSYQDVSLYLPEKTDFGNYVSYKSDSIFLIREFYDNDTRVRSKDIKVGSFTMTATATKAQNQVFELCLKAPKPKMKMINLQDEYFIYNTQHASKTIWYKNGIVFKPNFSQNGLFLADYESTYYLKIGEKACFSDMSDTITTPKDRIHTITQVFKDVYEFDYQLYGPYFIYLNRTTDFGNYINYTVDTTGIKENEQSFLTTKGYDANPYLAVKGFPGRVKLTAKAIKAKNVIFNFCVIPNKPTITQRIESGKTYLKSSSKSNNIWYLDGKLFNNELQEIVITKNGTYTVERNYDGCKNISDDLKIITLSTQSLVLENWNSGVNELNNRLIANTVEHRLESNKSFIIYPNPVQNTLNIINNKDNNAILATIYSLTGKKLIEKTSISKQLTIDISELPSANYLIELRNDKAIEVLKFFKN
jgi:Secretion system C-terminal sorting domain/Right handed beta helix region